MSLYAETPSRRLAQVLGDLLLLAWIAVWVWVGRLVHDMVVALAEPVVGIEGRATDLSRTLREAGASVSDVPLVGDRLQVPFERASGTGDGIARSSADLVQRIHDVATLLGVLLAAIPILVVGLLWVWRRVAFARRSAAAQRFVDADADLDLFALRAIAGQPLPVLARISDDPAGAWRRRDPEVVRQLAVLELAHHGLRPPAGTPAAPPR
ncbi:hypothetical protein [Arsenicicoccus sp. oral taxon 190]|uniref:hypothetical protein n=1 Tax=Arsenicicoccus sp. oral taxon 190 TaxID=1658671 RepID=UPI00067A09A0|nr:hypothetical protein [Arsenicicoccus sp. oral taxon 190]AKT51818.1 membrane protein [Arsenicicoccus sp. oral taxon 190]